MNIKEQLQAILAQVLEFDQKQFDWDTVKQLSDIGINSVNYIKLLIRIEATFGFEISDDYLDETKITTFKDLYLYVKTMVEDAK